MKEGVNYVKCHTDLHTVSMRYELRKGEFYQLLAEVDDQILVIGENGTLILNKNSREGVSDKWLCENLINTWEISKNPRIYQVTELLF